MSEQDHQQTTAATARQRVAVVTGASGGMGLATATMLAKLHGMKVYLIARSAEKGQAAVQHVNEQSGRHDAQLITCDLASLRSIHQAADQLLNAASVIDVLVNNAGVITLKREETEDGFERQLGVNHLGHFVFTGRLMPLLMQSDAGRIVVVSSGAHKIGRMNYTNPDMKSGFTIWGAYGRSKLANIWFTKELASRVAHLPITVNALHPGAVATQIGVDRNSGFGSAIHRLLRPFFQTPEQGSATAIYLATSEEVSSSSGQYYYKQKPSPHSAASQDMAKARQFWEWSEQVTGFTWDTLN